MTFGNIRIIAEVASNHGGNLALAKEFIKIASKVGADYVKFQTYRYKDLAKEDDPQAEWIKKTELPEDVYPQLIQECQNNKIKFLTTCFSINYLSFLSSLGIDDVKVASPDLLNFKMIEALAARFKHLFISTGMHSISETENAVDFLIENKINATLLHAVSLYPTPLENAWMAKFFWLKSIYPQVGYSDHTPGIEVAKFAMANGALVIEKHFKLGQYGPGRATAWDARPEEMEELVKYRNFLQQIKGPETKESNIHWLFEEEIKARERFLGRWRND